MKRLLLLIACAATLSACDSSPPTWPVVLNYWRPISTPNVWLEPSMASNKLNYDLDQCKCDSRPINVPHHELARIAPDRGRMMETSAMGIDDPAGNCITSPGAVLMECMRQRGWEPASCSGRMNTAGGTACALTVDPDTNYPDDYPYRGPRDTSFDGGRRSPAEERQAYPQ